MTYKNIDIIREFIKEKSSYKRSKNLFFTENVLYSYDYHYPLCIKVRDGFIINKDSYSQTTTRHTNILIREISNLNNLKEVIKNNPLNIFLMTTSEMHNLIFKEKDFKNKRYDYV